MLSLKNNYLYNLRSFFLTKFNISKSKQVIKLSTLFIYMYINIEIYKKNILLLFIVINLFFDSIYKKIKYSSQSYLIASTNYELRFKILNKSIFLFLFITFYLPCIENKNKILRTLGLNNKNLILFLDYISFPIIPEIDSLYTKFSEVYNFLSKYKFKLIFNFQIGMNKIIYSEFLLRAYKILCITSF